MDEWWDIWVDGWKDEWMDQIFFCNYLEYFIYILFVNFLY